jgi:F0F1-type ATP synthase membrane subunit c/vacuolar-type H+-ATPase subunit K
MDYEDPGWEPVLKRISWGLIPIIGPLLILRRRRPADGLTTIRLIYLGIVVALWLLVVVLLFIVPSDRWFATDQVGWVLMVVVAGLISLAGVQWVRSRPLDVTSAASLGATYRGNFFVGIGLAEGAALVGFVTTFFADAFWPYLIGLLFSNIGMVLIGPSKREIARRQGQIQGHGSPLSLGKVLKDGTSPS